MQVNPPRLAASRREAGNQEGIVDRSFNNESREEEAMSRKKYNISLNGSEFALFYLAVKELLRQEERDCHGSSGVMQARNLLELLEENRKLANGFDPAGSEMVAFELKLGQKELWTAYGATAEAVKSHLVLDEAKVIYRRLRLTTRRLFKRTELGKGTNLAA